MVDLPNAKPRKPFSKPPLLVDKTDARSKALYDQSIDLEMREEPGSYGFQTPGFIPIEIAPPVVIPLAPVKGKPTIPIKIDHTKGGRDWSRKLRQLQAKQRAATQARANAARMQKLGRLKYGRLAGAAPWAVGFQIGWTIGDFLWPNGWYDFATPDPGSPQTDGWIHPAYDYVPCNNSQSCPYTGPYLFKLYDQSPQGPQCGPSVGCTALGSLPLSTGYGTPLAAEQAAVGLSPIQVGRQRNTSSTVWYAEGSLIYQGGGYDPDLWEQVSPTPAGTPMPLVHRLPSEFPETFPMSQPMELPFPQTFKEAVPKKKTQGEGKHRKRHVTIPNLPLAPFPVVRVVPPGGNVPPPPDQVITIPPPAGGVPGSGPGTQPPPTYHTTPSTGRTAPRGRTKEKKLSVRSVANKTWIVANLATEAFDFIDALFDALPKHCQDKAKASIDYGREGGGNADPWSKAKAAYDCFGEIDWDKFVNNFINQQLQDMTIGMLGMMSQKYLKMTGQATGSGGLVSKPAGTGDDYIDKFVDEQVAAGNMTEEEGKAIKQAGQLPIPEVEYQGDGTWTVTIPQWGLTFG